MKIGVSCYSFQRLLRRGEMTYYSACDAARHMGYEGIEFIDLDTQYGAGEATVAELAAHLRAHCENLGLEIIAYTISADFLNGRDCAPQDEPARVMKCVDVAQALGAKVLRHDAYWRLSGTKDWRAAADRCVSGIRQVADYAQQRGIRTCTENHGRIMQDSERMEYLMRAVGHENYGWLVDIGNFLCVDEDPQHAVGVAAPYAVHVHVKDFLLKSGVTEAPSAGWLYTRGGNWLRGTVVGHGTVNVPGCLRALTSAGYDGYLSVEFEGAEEVLPALEAAHAYMKRLLG